MGERVPVPKEEETKEEEKTLGTGFTIMAFSFILLGCAIMLCVKLCVVVTVVEGQQ